LLTDEIVALYVGPKRKAYHVHKALLCNRSSYFRAVFRDDVQFREGAENDVYSPDDSPRAFAQLTLWSYGGKIFKARVSDDPNLYFLLFALGEKLCLEKLPWTRSSNAMVHKTRL
jgi:BTB/POZ domain